MKNTNISSGWQKALLNFSPGDGREAEERRIMLELLEQDGDRLLSRESAFAHFTASAIIVNRDRTKTLMAFHRIYESWAWTGGHADNDPDPEMTARREAEEETGICDLRLLCPGAASVEILPVWAHVKRGKDVGSHLHLNLSYLYEANDTLPLRVAPEENSSIGWIPIDHLSDYVTEKEMIPIYEKLLARANDFKVL